MTVRGALAAKAQAETWMVWTLHRQLQHTPGFAVALNGVLVSPLLLLSLLPRLFRCAQLLLPMLTPRNPPQLSISCSTSRVHQSSRLQRRRMLLPKARCCRSPF
jgi:hypothetical protein